MSVALLFCLLAHQYAQNISLCNKKIVDNLNFCLKSTALHHSEEDRTLFLPLKTSLQTHCATHACVRVLCLCKTQILADVTSKLHAAVEAGFSTSCSKGGMTGNVFLRNQLILVKDWLVPFEMPNSAMLGNLLLTSFHGLPTTSGHFRECLEKGCFSYRTQVLVPNQYAPVRGSKWSIP